jgi:hypothetical protein
MTDIQPGDYISSVDMNSLLRKSEGFGILTGLSASASPSSLIITISSGTARVGSNISPFIKTLSVATTQTMTSDASLPRKATIFMNVDGNISSSLGVINAAIPYGSIGRRTEYPVPPNIPETSVLISEVWIPAGATIGSSLTLYNEHPLNYVTSGTSSTGSAQSASLNNVSPYVYTVWQDGSTYYGRNGRTGEIDASDSNATTLIQSLSSASTGSIYLVNVTFSPNISLSSKNVIWEELNGQIRIWKPRVYMWYSVLPFQNQSRNDVALSYANMNIYEFMTATSITWERKGVVMKAGEPNPSVSNWEYTYSSLSICAEPHVIYHSGHFKMWYRGSGNTAARIGFAESVDGLNWNKWDSNPVGGVSGNALAYPTVVYNTNSSNPYWMYFTKVGGGTGEYQLWTGTTELAFSSTSNGNPVFTASAAGNWDSGAIANNSIWTESSNWYMIYEAFKSGTMSWKLGLASSGDGKVWTRSADNPILDAGYSARGGPWVVKVDNTYMLVYHGAPSASLSLPTQIYRATSTTLASKSRESWGETLIYECTGSTNMRYEGDQAADPCLIYGNACYSFPDGSFLTLSSAMTISG